MRRSVLAVLLVTGACARGAGDRPPEVAVREATCDFCHMTIEDERRAGAIVPVTGTPKLFDEAGCLMHYAAMSAQALAQESRLWVHDEASGEWLDARSAFFVLPARPVPGMHYGILAYRDRAHADEAKGEGRVKSFDELLAELRG